jgi:hypothetical protein
MSCGPTAAELAQIRADVASVALDLNCIIQRKTETLDAWGTSTTIWDTISPSGLKAGMKSPSPSMLMIYAEQIGAKLAWQVNFPWGTDVQIQDHIIIGNDTMIVQAILSQQSYSSLTTVLAVEIQHE